MQGNPGNVRQNAPPPGVVWQLQPGALLQLRILHESALLSPTVTGVKWIEHTGMGPRFSTAKLIRMTGGVTVTLLKTIWKPLAWACRTTGVARSSAKPLSTNHVPNPFIIAYSA